MKAVADSSVLIGLGMLGLLKVLNRMFDRVFVPPAVWREVAVRGEGLPGSEIAREEIVTVREVRDKEEARRLAALLGEGEAEALVLAQEVRADVVLVDDAKARRKAVEKGLEITGLAGLLVAAKRKGLVGEVGSLLRKLTEGGFRLGEEVIERALREAGEG